MQRINYVSLFILLMISFAHGQGDAVAVNRLASSSCPIVVTSNPSDKFQAGETATYSVNLEGEFDKEKIKYKWSIENGTILNGEGTSTINIITSKDLDLSSVKLKLKIEGYDNRCESNYEAELGKPLAPPKPRLIDEIGELQEEDTRARLDAFLVEILNNPNDTAYIVNYGTDKEIKARESIFKNHFKFRAADTKRIYFVHAGKGKTSRSRLWLASPGADTSIID